MTSRGPDWPGLAWEGLLLAACAGLLAWRGLGQVRPMAVSTARLVVQMLLLAVVLRAIIAADHPAVVLAVALAMLAAAAHTIGSRQARHRWEYRLQGFGAMAVGAAVTMAVSVGLALRVEPWYDARTIIPMLGMILGNSVTAVSLSAERFAAELKADRDLVETRLALGATARQAALPALRSAVAAGLTPILNNMAIAGIVAIPGMTTGQLLAGADVGPAIRYQILLYLAIASTVGLAVPIMLALRLRRHFTTDHRLGWEAIDG